MSTTALWTTSSWAPPVGSITSTSMNEPSTRRKSPARRAAVLVLVSARSKPNPAAPATSRDHMASLRVINRVADQVNCRLMGKSMTGPARYYTTACEHRRQTTDMTVLDRAKTSMRTPKIGYRLPAIRATTGTADRGCPSVGLWRTFGARSGGRGRAQQRRSDAL